MKGCVRGRFGDYWYKHKSDLKRAFPSIMAFSVWMRHNEKYLPKEYSPDQLVLIKKKHFKKKYFSKGGFK